jgi:hypothetical protein
MGLLDSLLQSATGCCKAKDVVYDFKVKNAQDDLQFVWYVVDANHGYTVFSYEHPEDEDTEPVFQKWFRYKNEAIEFALDGGRAEKLAKGL